VTEIGSSQQGQVPAGAEPAGEAVALLAVLLADEPDLTHRALVDGVDLGDDRLSRRLACGGARQPDGRPASNGAGAPNAGRLSRRRHKPSSRIVTNAVHAHLLGGSTSTPLWNNAASTDESDEVGRVDGPPAALGRGDELVGHGESGRA